MTMLVMRGGAQGADVGRWWVYVLVGVVFVLLGLLVLGDVMLASIAIAIFAGAAIAVGGAFQIVHAFWERGWQGFLLSLLVGLLYLIGGVWMMANPVAGVAALTLVIAAMLIVSGVVRIILAFRLRPVGMWMLVVSGVLALVLGFLVIAGWPVSGLVVLGLFLGIDLLWFGLWWIVMGFALRTAHA